MIDNYMHTCLYMQYMRGPFSFIVKNRTKGNISVSFTKHRIREFNYRHCLLHKDVPGFTYPGIATGHLRKKVIASALPIFIHKGCIFSLITNLGEQISITG